MNEDPTSLARLHDIVVPPDVAWWPLAAGWYVVIAGLALAMLWYAARLWRRWQTNGYRRAALRELASAHSAAEVSALLRRTALAVYPRSTIAPLAGGAWADWLSHTSPAPLSHSARRQLVSGAYAGVGNDQNLGELREYAATWVRQHRSPEPKGK